MLLDTSFVIDLIRGRGDVEAALDGSSVEYVSSVTVMELWEGIHLTSSTNEERDRVKRCLSDVEELPFDRDCATEAGRLNAELIKDGTPVDETDVMLGATALVHDQPVLTRNVEHFEVIDGVDVVTY